MTLPKMESSRNVKFGKRMVNELAEDHPRNDLHHLKQSLWTLWGVMGKARNKMFSEKKQGVKLFTYCVKISM